MSGFKLLAIRPLEGYDEKYRKNLIPGQIYQFYQDYKFDLSEDKKEVISVTPLPSSVPSDLYSIKRKGKPDLEINISAVVGKNGSGKSALFDLLYITSYILISKFKIPIESPIIPGTIGLSEYSFDKGINYEIFFLDNEVLCHLQINNSDQIFSLFKKDSQNIFSKFCSEKNSSSQIDYNGFQNWEDLFNSKDFVFPLANYFYSIAINYSIYGLYGEESSWLDSLFHKNDGYQTPLVINPYRYHGIINVKSEHELAQARILVNVEHFNNDEILKGKRISRIDFEFDLSRLLELFDSPFHLTVTHTVELSYYEVLVDLFDEVYYKLTGERFKYYDLTPDYLIEKFLLQKRKNQINVNGFDEFTPYLIKYIVYKIFKLIIRDNYLRNLYGTSFKRGKEGNLYGISIKSKEELDSLVTNITNTTSHLTLKIRQAVFALKNQCFNGKELFLLQSQKSLVAVFKFEYHEFINKLAIWKLHNININKSDVELIPGAFAKIKIGINHDPSSISESDIHHLSSGEQQLIITLQTLYYHLQNLDSVDEKKRKVRYKNINILMDEIELYFHPEYQQQFISELIRGLQIIDIPKIKSLNILFSTHSPFILSDIPSQNVLHLKNGEPQGQPEKGTFGANVHDLLHDSFFLEEGFMGKFAEEKINETITFLYFKKKLKILEEALVSEKIAEKRNQINEELNLLKGDLESRKIQLESLENHYSIIQLIGEPVLKEKLLETYHFVAPDNSKRELLLTEIRRLIKSSGIDNFNINEI